MTQVIAGVVALATPVPWSVIDTASLAAAVLTAAALLFTLLLVARAPATAPLHAIASSVRHNAEETAFLRLRDPDASGRPRPRAPGQ